MYEQGNLCEYTVWKQLLSINQCFHIGLYFRKTLWVVTVAVNALNESMFILRGRGRSILAWEWKRGLPGMDSHVKYNNAVVT